MSILSIGELLDLGNSAATAGLVPYSALEYNASGDISGISGSAIAGGVDSAIVSSIASSYVESGVSSKVDQSAFDECCSAMSAVVSAKLDASASSNFAPSGDYYSATNPSGFITTADITGKLDSTASSLFQPSGSYADASSLSSKLDASASSMFAPSGNYQSAGDYAFNSSLSSKLDASASSEFYLTSNPSGFIDSSYLSGKLDASASGNFAPSGDYAYNSAISSYVNYSAISGENGKVTSINGSGISAQAVPTLPLYVASPLTAGIDEMSSQVTIGFPGVVVQIVSSEAEATGTNIVYVVTGSN